jgi:hypothetical protein
MGHSIGSMYTYMGYTVGHPSHTAIVAYEINYFLCGLSGYEINKTKFTIY